MLSNGSSLQYRILKVHRSQTRGWKSVLVGKRKMNKKPLDECKPSKAGFSSSLLCFDIRELRNMRSIQHNSKWNDSTRLSHIVGKLPRIMKKLIWAFTYNKMMAIDKFEANFNTERYMSCNN